MLLHTWPPHPPGCTRRNQRLLPHFTAPPPSSSLLHLSFLLGVWEEHPPSCSCSLIHPYLSSSPGPLERAPPVWAWLLEPLKLSRHLHHHRHHHHFLILYLHQDSNLKLDPVTSNSLMDNPLSLHSIFYHKTNYIDSTIIIA